MLPFHSVVDLTIQRGFTALLSPFQVFIHKISLSWAWADGSMVKELAKFSEDCSTFPRIGKEPNYSPFEAR